MMACQRSPKIDPGTTPELFRIMKHEITITSVREEAKRGPVDAKGVISVTNPSTQPCVIVQTLCD